MEFTYLNDSNNNMKSRKENRQKMYNKFWKMKNHQEINLTTQTTFDFHADERNALLH